MAESSAEHVQCPTCGKQYRWSDQLAGRKVKCKGCGNAFRVEKPAADQPRHSNSDLKANRKSTSDYELSADDFSKPELAASSVAAGNIIKCPSCNQDMPEQAILCIKCGFNRKDKKKLKTALQESEVTAPPQPTAKVTVTDPITAQKLREADTRKQFDAEFAADLDRKQRIVDLYAPLILIGTGAVLLGLNIFVLAPLAYSNGLISPVRVMMGFVIITGVLIAIQLPLLFAGIFLVAKLFGTDYGTLGSGVLKLAALCLVINGVDIVFTSGLDLMAPGLSAMSWLLQISLALGIFFSLCYFLFDMQAKEGIILFIILVFLPDLAINFIQRLLET